MPPKITTSKEMIIEAGYGIADEEGIDQVNCRAIAKKLGCSTQPVFSRFPNMDELKEEVFKYACDKLQKSIADGLEHVVLPTCAMKVINNLIIIKDDVK